MRPRFRSLLILIAIALSVLGIFSLPACTGTRRPVATKTAKTDAFSTPIFTSPKAKLAELSNPKFTKKLFSESTALEARLAKPGTQVHMGFYSGPGNHGSLVRVLDAINNYQGTDGTVHRAIWDEGVTTSLQIPSYVTMNREVWYERAFPTDGKATIFGVARSDFPPVTPAQADAIWGQYSRRYTDQAALFAKATGKPVQVWCFVQGAKANRIFYTNEFVELKELEADGAVEVHFAKTDDADWTKPSDWTTGTADHPPALK